METAKDRTKYPETLLDQRGSSKEAVSSCAKHDADTIALKQSNEVTTFKDMEMRNNTQDVAKKHLLQNRNEGSAQTLPCFPNTLSLCPCKGANCIKTFLSTLCTPLTVTQEEVILIHISWLLHLTRRDSNSSRGFTLDSQDARKRKEKSKPSLCQDQRVMES